MEIKSEYLGQFEKAAKHFQLMGNKLLVERIELGEVKTAGGIIIAESSNVRADLKLQKPHIGIVLAVGKGYYDPADGSYDELEIKPGMVIMYNGLGAQYYSVLPGVAGYSNNKVGLTTEADVQAVFASIEEFEAYAKALSI